LGSQGVEPKRQQALFALDVTKLVNNAGVMPPSPLSALKIDEWNWMIDVNVRGVLHGIAAVLLRMEARGQGHIINASSVGGFVAQPTAAVYAATKFAVRAISEGLRKERDKIRCVCVYPDIVTSELANSISDPVARERIQTYRKMAIGPDAIGRAIQFAISRAHRGMDSAKADADLNGHFPVLQERIWSHTVDLRRFPR
jgi:NADP-dependent 3-hydroxy acid dehydrogenase YdfG